MSEKVIVTNLRGKAWNVAKVRGLFIVFGPVKEVTLPKEGVALIVFKYANDASEAVDNMNGAEVENVYIRAENVKAQETGELRIDSRYAVWGKSRREAVEDDDNEVAT